MAEVYEVEDRVSGEHLALKLLVQTGGATARFNREYEAMIRLNHPNIVRVYAYGLLRETSRGRASSSARSRTRRPSRSSTSRSTAGRTCTASACCCTAW
jgi:serine/threonine protein kinase